LLDLFPKALKDASVLVQQGFVSDQTSNVSVSWKSGKVLVSDRKSNVSVSDPKVLLHPCQMGLILSLFWCF